MGVAAVLEVTGDSVHVLARETPSCEPGPAPAELVEAALDWIDDPIGLLDERPVAVADIWRSLIVALVGESCRSIAVVHPEDWPRHRIDRVVAAANTVAQHVEAIGRDRRSEVLSQTGAHGEQAHGRPVHPRRRRRIGATLVVLATAVVLASAALSARSTELSAAGVSAVTVVEGRVAVVVPAGWKVERITGGPGSRRIQVSPPSDPAIALHLTSAYAPDTTLEHATDQLRRAMAAEPAGVFVDLHLADDVAGRVAVTYRERRPGRVVSWSVVLVGSTRISIGCQSPPGREADIRSACEQATRSARET